jgi:hypothetical protein
MKVFDTETTFCNEEELVEAIHEAMLLIKKGTPFYFDFDDRAFCTMPYSSFDDDNPNQIIKKSYNKKYCKNFSISMPIQDKSFF